MKVEKQFVTHPGLKVKKTEAGLGLITTVPIKKGSFIIEYDGPRLTNKEADEKLGKYLFEVNNTTTIDGSSRKNIARYVNHGCRPNCEIEVKKGRVLLFARKNIKADEELSYDYGKEYYDHFIKPYGCKCSSAVHKK